MTRGVVLLSAVLALACAGEGTPEPEAVVRDDAAGATPPTKLPDPRTVIAPPERHPRAEQPGSAPTGEPFHVAATSGGMRYADAFTFYGWSADGTKYAFSTFYPGPGARTCEGKAQFFVVNADTDAYVKGAHTVWTLTDEEAEPEDGECPDEGPEQILKREADLLLEQHGIVKGLGTTVHRVEPRPRPHITSPKGDTLYVNFEQGGDGWDDGAWFELALKGPRTTTLVLETGKRKRASILSYTPVYAFFGPGDHLAFVTERSGIDFEGRNLSRMTNGAKLPTGW